MERIMYKQIPNHPIFNKPAQGIVRLSDNAFIPLDEANTDYQEFLRWKEQGNEPLPSDE